MIIVDRKIPEEAKINLRKCGLLMELETNGITYPAISGHPDIFFTQINDKLLIAPNLPDRYLRILERSKIKFETGENPVGKKYPETACYNAVVTSKHLIHNLKITDQGIAKLCNNKNNIHVNQGYTRCNLVFLDKHNAITSDASIAKTVIDHGINPLLVDPTKIDLPGFNNGFFGGCCGVFNKQLFVLGNLNKYPDGEKVRNFSEKINIPIIQLCNTPLFDGGGVFFQNHRD